MVEQLTYSCQHRRVRTLNSPILAQGDANVPITDSDLPKSLLDRLELDTVQKLAVGRLGNQLHRVCDKDEGPAYLKIGTGIASQDQLDEAKRLDWIGHHLPVPRVLHCATHGNRTFVLITELPGVPSHECFEAISVPTAVEKLAEGLKMIHAVSTDDCPFDQVLENELKESARRIGCSGLNVEAFVADTGAAPSKVLDDLAARTSQVSDFVFTHGDYCFPNLLLDGQRISGIVDWGIAGVSDRHRDFMSIELTIRRNCGEEWIPTFYESYGASEVDPERIRFFWLLDRFFSHYEYPTCAEALSVPA